MQFYGAKVLRDFSRHTWVTFELNAVLYYCLTELSSGLISFIVPCIYRM